MATSNQQVRVMKRASGIPTPDVFELVEQPIPKCSTGGVLVRVLYAAVDPAMRGWLGREANYMTVPDGSVMRAEGVSEVLESRHPNWRVGDRAYGLFGWQQYAAVTPKELYWPIDTRVAPAHVWLGALGINGLTAWIGFNHFGRPKAGQTVLVSTAAGAVGSVVAGLACAAGLKAVGLTSSPEKVKRCLQTLGYSDAINYRTAPDLARAIFEACPSGVDIYYDNTAGAIADAVFLALNRGARVVQCGTASIETWTPVPTGPRRERDMIVKRLSWHGFVVLDHTDLFSQALAQLQQLYAAGALDTQTDILEGLESAPTAIQRLFNGDNTGRLCVRP